MNNLKLVKFTDNDFELEVNVSPDEETVWLSKEDLALLFERDRSVISRHISSIYNEGELDEKSTCAKNAYIPSTRKRNYEYNLYNLDVIISVGYRVKSQRGIKFRKWASKVLKDFLIQGYVLNEARLIALNKTIEIQTRMLSYALNIDKEELFKVIDGYTKALDLLDDYDHQSLAKPKGTTSDYLLTYKEAREIIDSMKFNEKSEIFGVEKEEGKLNGIISQVYQNVFGKELYPTVEEKAAHLLYFLVKDHPFVDGCKRIAATLFINFLFRNGVLYKNNRQIISNEALVALTILTAESNPDEIEIITKLIANLLV